MYLKTVPLRYSKKILAMKRIFLFIFLLISSFLIQKSYGQGVGIGIKNPDPSAKLHIHSTQQGTLITRMTSVQRDSIVNPADGLLIYNLDSKCINLFKNQNWFEVCGTCIAPAAPVVANNGPLCVNDTLSLTASSLSGASYSWSGPNGFTSNLQNPKLNGVSIASAGVYSVYVSRGGCNSNSVSTTLAVNACGMNSINYPNGNEAYWMEAVSGYRPVSIAGGSAIYIYNPSTKQYANGNNILLPNLSAVADGDFVNASSFYGYSGGVADNNNYQWDAQSNSSVVQPSIFDQINMFISPVSVNDMNYCSAMQYSNPNCGNTVVDGPNTSLAYPNNTPLSGFYNLSASAEQINAGNLKGGGNNYFSQQQIDPNSVQSYCVATYGKGWRIPTDIEMGHTTNTYGWNMGIDPSYNATVGGGDYHLWTSAREIPNGIGGRFILWPLGTYQNGYWDGNGVSATNQKVRCVYQGR